MEVGPAETNQCIGPFYPSVDPSMEDDAAIVLSSFRETTKILKIHLIH